MFRIGIASDSNLVTSSLVNVSLSLADRNGLLVWLSARADLAVSQRQRLERFGSAWMDVSLSLADRNGLGSALMAVSLSNLMSLVTISFQARNHPRRMLELVHVYAGGFVDSIPYVDDDFETKRSDVIVMAAR